MGGFELIFWLAIIIFSILRGLQQNKKPVPPGNSPPEGAALDPLQEAIREIESALRGEKPPAQDPVERSTFDVPVSQPPERRSQTEPEFHSLESSISLRNIEAESSFKEEYISGTLESSQTYEDIFPESRFYDDTYRHAHPVEQPAEEKKKSSERVKTLRKRLRNRKELADAIVLQTILNRRSFPPNRRS